MSDENSVNFLRVQVGQLHANIATAVGNEALSGVAASQANQRARGLQENLNDLYRRVDELKEEVQHYKDLLAKPLHEIAHQSEDFRKAYGVQQELLASWMVSQRAFKELAIELGLALGKTKESVVSEGMAKRRDVLDNKTRHNNDLGDDFYVKPHLQKLKQSMDAS